MIQAPSCSLPGHFSKRYFPSVYPGLGFEVASASEHVGLRSALSFLGRERRTAALSWSAQSGSRTREGRRGAQTHTGSERRHPGTDRSSECPGEPSVLWVQRKLRRPPCLFLHSPGRPSRNQGWIGGEGDVRVQVWKPVARSRDSVPQGGSCVGLCNEAPGAGTCSGRRCVSAPRVRGPRVQATRTPCTFGLLTPWW